MARRELAGKTALVTGATSGIGFATAVGLARMHARVLLHGRTAFSANAAAARLRRDVPDAQVEVVDGDLASLSAIRQLARQVQSHTPVLDILINNAGFITTQRQQNPDGVELQLAVNHVAPFFLTQKLLDELTAGQTAGRVINVTSKLHFRGKPNLEDLNWTRRPYKGTQAYADSKFALMALTHAWSQRMPAEKVTFNAVHPGVVSSQFASKGTWFAFAMPVLRSFMISAEEGAKTSLHLASVPELAHVSGHYFDNANVHAPHPATLNPALQEKLWTHTASMCGLSA